jgi:aspartokinase-like uncharacterized kinase
MNAALVKVGGSLATHPEKLRLLCKRLDDFSKIEKLVVVPGGGEFADAVRVIDRRFNLSNQVAHRMAILGMDQYGMLLLDLIPNSVLVKKIEEIVTVLSSGRLPVFLPSTFMINEDPLENSWDVTSDAIAVYIASRLEIKKVLLIKDVDGIYHDAPKKHPETKLITKISSSELSEINRQTSVDKSTPLLASRLGIDCFVVNGFFPERISAILEDKDTICTRII